MKSQGPYSLVPPSPCVPTTPQPLDCQAPPVSSRGKERARTSTPRPEPCRAPARVRPLGGLRVLGVQAKGVGSPLPPPLTSHRPSPQVLERGATRAPPTGPGLTFPAREALLAEEEEAGEGRALCLPRVLPRLQLGPSPSPSRPPELWSDGAGEPKGRGHVATKAGPGGCQCQRPSWVRGPPGTGLPRVGVWVLQGRTGQSQASSSVCPEVPPTRVVWVSHPALGGAPAAASSLCGFLVLNGRGLQRLQQAVEREPGWGHRRWVESRDGWP